MTEASARGEIVIERNILIGLSDGTELAADLYRPAGDGSFPALWSFYPYHKDDMMGAMMDAPGRYFAQRGYAHLLVDFRGLGGSSGVAWEAMDRREGEDGAEVVAWIARQKWCDGNVGMWGLSYGAISAFKVAAENPPHLKAIVPIEGSVDIYRDYLRPGGCLSCLGSFGAWGSFMLAMNLMPPTNRDAGGRWYRVWLERLEKGVPYVLPWHDHPDYDEYWQSRAVDPAAITIPTYLIGGWRDIFPDGMVAVYPLLKGPKKLLMGPWMHTLPNLSPFEPVDFLALMKRWFDHWLRGEKNGIESEPPVTLNVQGANVWKHEREWPIERTEDRLLFAASGGALLKSAESGESAENYRGDGTVGSAAGLWDPMAIGWGLPLDQGDDDLHSLGFTSEPLGEDIEITGAPELVLRAALTNGTDANLVAKLCDVSPTGASSLITTGWLKASHRLSSESPEPVKPGKVGDFTIALWSTSYRVPKGHRIRLSVSCSDFPHIWPERVNPELRVMLGGEHGSRLSIPVVPALAQSIDGPPVPRPETIPAGTPPIPVWKIERDVVAGSVHVTTGEKVSFPVMDGGAMEVDHLADAETSRPWPDAASVKGDTKIRLQMRGMSELEIHTTSRVTTDGMTLTARIATDGRTMFEKRWRK